ncbi:hypothetical protein [Synechococcus sp. PROS-7-1]|uniref:hypothetical protein n=1 Tax=Synechococcus sp. PROS-7-1 TaxID=1442556 RepID=UPI001645CE73|nr:hypothetical protein [Synechococcus sp. PROS-7-1]
MTNNELTTYSVSWQVFVLLPARMNVQAPAGLDEQDLIQYIRENCLADFKIDTDELDYDNGFADLENYFDAEVVEEGEDDVA